VSWLITPGIRNVPGHPPWLDQHGVETNVETSQGRVARQKGFGAPGDSPLLARPDRFCGNRDSRAGLDFDHGQYSAAPGHDIDFAGSATPAAGEAARQDPPSRQA
jgi:hypothetical protein